MSLYNVLFGVNKAAPILLAILGLTTDDIMRFRDCFISNGKIVIHTRTGGNNRKDYDNSELAKNPFYISDEDDEFDDTYANYFFKFPDEYAEDLKALSINHEAYMPSEKWKTLLKQMENRS